MNMIKITSKLLGMMAITTLMVPAASAQIVYQNDFSSAPTITDTAPSGNNTSPRIKDDFSMPTAGNSSFLEDFVDLTHDAGNEHLDFSNNAENAWLLINTSTWATGDYTVSFDGLVASGNTMYWDVIGGSAFVGTGLGVRIWMNKDRPYIRNAGSGSAERLGQPVAELATTSGAAGSFTDTTFTSQSLNVSLTADHVGSANDYLLIGWNNVGGNGAASIDNLEIALVPEPSSFALLTLSGLALLMLRRRRRVL